MNGPHCKCAADVAATQVCIYKQCGQYAFLCSRSQCENKHRHGPNSGKKLESWNGCEVKVRKALQESFFETLVTALETQLRPQLTSSKLRAKFVRLRQEKLQYLRNKKFPQRSLLSKVSQRDYDNILGSDARSLIKYLKSRGMFKEEEQEVQKMIAKIKDKIKSLDRRFDDIVHEDEPRKMNILGKIATGVTIGSALAGVAVFLAKLVQKRLESK